MVYLVPERAPPPLLPLRRTRGRTAGRSIQILSLCSANICLTLLAAAAAAAAALQEEEEEEEEAGVGNDDDDAKKQPSNLPPWFVPRLSPRERSFSPVVFSPIQSLDNFSPSNSSPSLQSPIG